MPAGLTEYEGEVQFAYNKQNGHPWHVLGTPLEGYMEIDDALAAIEILDEDIYPVDLVDTEGMPARELQAVKSSKYGHMGYAHPSYSIMTPKEILEIAYEILGLAGDEAKLDTIGRIGAYGQRFFAYIRNDDLVIDPGGIADVIERGYVVATSFDRSMKNIINPSKIRVVCNNTLEMSIKDLTGGIAVLHTSTAEARIRQAAAALEYAGAQEAELLKRVHKMMAEPGNAALNKIGRAFYNVEGAKDDRSRTRREGELASLHELYAKEKKKVGPTGWAAWNAFVEKQDHYLTVKRMPDAELTEDETKAFRAVFPGQVMKAKLKAADLVLS